MAAPETPIPDRLFVRAGGMAFFEGLVDRFYDGVEADPDLRPIYPESDLAGARHRLTLFLAQYWGGPTTYDQERGHPRLRMRHAPFAIGAAERDRWLVHMRAAVALKAPAPERSPDDRPDGDAATAPGTVVVLDFGSQFAQLIARRVRELDVYSELLPHDTPYEEIERRGARAIILSGGPMSVYDTDAPRPDPAIWSGRLPVLGICYGAQLMAHELGGDVLAADRREYGPANVSITTADGLFQGIDREQPVWMSHGDSITRLPEGFTGTAQTDSNPYAGLAAPERNLYGIQFHPEVVHTPRGRDVLRNFVVGIAGVEPDWTAANFIDTTVAGIRERVDSHAAKTGSDGLVIC